MIIEKQLEAVVRAGLFRDRQHAMQEAMQTLFAVRPQLRTEAAIELFRSGEVSLLRAAELAGLDFESFRLLLRDRAIPLEIEAENSAEMDRAIDQFFAEHPE
jgi:predicted HTH domain antitoxin